MYPVLATFYVDEQPFHIVSFGVFWLAAAAFAARALYLASGRSSRALRMGLVACIAGLFGAKAGYHLLNGQSFHLTGGGLHALSGFAVGLIAFAWLTRRHHELRRVALTQTGPSLLVASAIGRLGCYAEGCDFGRPLSDKAPAWLRALGTFPRWPEDFGNGSPAFAEHLHLGWITPHALHALPVHPTQLYESVLAAVLALVLLVRGDNSLRTAAVGYLMLRLGCEFLRGDADRGALLGLSVTQIGALLIMGGLLVYRLRSHAK